MSPNKHMKTQTKVTAETDAALARLSDDWQSLEKIKLSPDSGTLGFAELVLSGRAEARHDPYAPPGQRIQYKMKTKATPKPHSKNSIKTT